MVGAIGGVGLARRRPSHIVIHCSKNITKRILVGVCCRVGLVAHERQCNRYKRRAALERTSADVRHTAWNLNARQTRAVLKRAPADVRHTAWNLDARQSRAAIERIFSNARHTAWNLDTRQTCAARECPAADTRHIVGRSIIGDRGGNHDISTIRIVRSSFIRHRGICTGKIVIDAIDLSTIRQK